MCLLRIFKDKLIISALMKAESKYPVSTVCIARDHVSSESSRRWKGRHQDQPDAGEALVNSSLLTPSKAS